MRLLILTQAVDLNDPVLGFFHTWIERLAARCESIHVVCLRAGEHHLPGNVSVHSLGKEHGVSKFTYIVRFYRYIWRFRAQYDAVFVHMNQEYVLMGGMLWLLSDKRVVLWRNHKIGSLWTRVASFFAHTVCYTSPSAYVASFRNARLMPIGIDTESFKPGGARKENSILFLGRLDQVKRPDTFLEAIQRVGEGNPDLHVDVVGDPTFGREAYASDLKKRFAGLLNASFHAGVSNKLAAEFFRSHAIYVNLTPSGSFDKTIGEAASSGCTLVVANEALKGVLPDELLVDPDSVDSVASGIVVALGMTPAARKALAEKTRRFVEEHHSLDLLCDKLLPVLSPTHV